MKKSIIKAFSVCLVFMLVLSVVPMQAQAKTTVKINKTKTTIYVGKSTTLKITGTSKKITWSSSNKKVATVSSKGKVTAKKKGTATITAKVSGKSYKCKVTVKNPYLNATKKKLEVKKTYTLKLTGATAKKYTSSKKSVATVSSKGKITAVKAGTATITVTDSNKKTYKCVITVTNKKPTHTHSYTAKVTTPATCTTNGVKTYTCKNCGKIKTVTIEKADHNYQWETNSNTRTMKCSCGATKGVTETCYNGYWGYYDSAMATELFNLCNSARQEAQYVEYDAIGNIVYNGNVQAVSRDGSLDALATSRAVEVLSSWSHEGKDVDSYYISENLAKGFDTVFDIVCAWSASHDHAATMTYQYYTRAGAAWFWYDQDGTGENLIGVAVMEYGE